MPAFVTHALFGELVKKNLPQKQRLLIEAHPAPFYWGLQGPDLLFFRDDIYRRSPLPKVGSRLHKQKIPEQMEAFARYIRAKKRSEPGTEEVLLSYFLGYLCHYILDMTAHPYIYFLQERGKNYLPPKEWRGIHFRIESDIDTALCPILSGVCVKEYKIFRPLCTVQERAAIGRMLRHVVWDALGEEYSTKDLMLCFRDCHRLVRLALDRTGLLLPIAERTERLVCHPNTASAHVRRAKVERDVLNEKHGMWAALYDEDNPRTDSFFDLLEQSCDAAVDAVQSWYDGVYSGCIPDWRGYPGYDHGSPNEGR